MRDQLTDYLKPRLAVISAIFIASRGAVTAHAK
jgi:hypothetical protein